MKSSKCNELAQVCVIHCEIISNMRTMNLSQRYYYICAPVLDMNRKYLYS